MDYNGLIWIIKAYAQGQELVYWAFSPGDAASILEELQQLHQECVIEMELTTNPNYLN
jgi:hypothetical protein